MRAVLSGKDDQSACNSMNRMETQLNLEFEEAAPDSRQIQAVR